MSAPAAPVFEDRTLPHQMRILAEYTLNLISVSCNCMQDGKGRCVPLIEPARTITPDEALAAYNAHLAEVSGP